MKIYLDENLVSKKLIGLLRRHGHDPVTPADANLVGAPDQKQFEYACGQKIPLLTKDATDFLRLHQGNPDHAGIIAIYEEADLSKNMSAVEIVKALEQLQKKEGNLKRRFFVLNRYRIKT